jgi:hypothetical protein
MMVTRRVSETCENIFKEIERFGNTSSSYKPDVIQLVVGVKELLSEEIETVEYIAKYVETYIHSELQVEDLDAVARITVYVMMLGHSLFTQEDVLLDVKKGRIKL